MRLAIFLLLLPCLGLAQPGHSHKGTRSVRFPNTTTYKVLSADLHIHSVFSDGKVWPEIRVEEALHDDVDVISLTEHLEYQPHKADIPHPDRNRSFDIATRHARNHDLLILKGSEITRRMPPGHCNAIFISDANKLLIADSMEVFREAGRQNAFVFWNHPNWTAQRSDGMATMTPMHQRLISEKLLHGIEVVNEMTISEEAMQIALDHNLTMMGTSDIHGLVDWQFNIVKGGHRPVTLVLAKEKTEAAIREALFAGRTVVYYNDILAGREAWLSPVLQQCLVADSAGYSGKSQVLHVALRNNSPTKLTLRNRGPFTFHNATEVFSIEAGQTMTLEIKTLQRLTTHELKFEVLNALTAPSTHPVLTWPISTSDKPWRGE